MTKIVLVNLTWANLLVYGDFAGDAFLHLDAALEAGDLVAAWLEGHCRHLVRAHHTLHGGRRRLLGGLTPSTLPVKITHDRITTTVQSQLQFNPSLIHVAPHSSLSVEIT